MADTTTKTITATLGTGYPVRGEKGDTGASGFSPSATVTQTDTGATISITDASGTTTADLKDVTKDNISAALGYVPNDLLTSFELLDSCEITETGTKIVSRWINLKAVMILYDGTSCTMPGEGVVARVYFSHTDGSTFDWTRYFYPACGFTMAYMIYGFPFAMCGTGSSLSTNMSDIRTLTGKNMLNEFAKGATQKIYYYQFSTDCSTGFPVGMKIRIYGVRA